MPTIFLPHRGDRWSRENDAPAGAPPIRATVPRIPTESAACRSTLTSPAQSKLRSAGPPQISCTAATGSTSGEDTLIVSVAPSSAASASRETSLSTAMMCVAAVSRAAMIADSPTAPDPYTTIDDPAKGRSALSTAPAPVEIPQARGPSSDTSTSAGTGTRALAAQIEYDANDDWPKKWLCSGDPSSRRSEVDPSARQPAMTSGPSCRQYRGCPSRQVLHVD